MKGVPKNYSKLLFFCIIMIFSLVHPIEAETLYVCGLGCNFSNISSAVEYAKDGDLIYVKSGTYKEYIVINKSISIIGDGDVNIYPLDKTSLIIGVYGKNITIKNLKFYGKQNIECIEVLASSDVILENIELYNCQTGINIVSSNNVSILKFIIKDSVNGIEASNSYNIVIENGDIYNSEFSIGFNSTSTSKLSFLNILNTDIGIYFVGSSENKVSNTEIHGSGSYISFGIQLYNSERNTIENSKITKFGVGIDLEYSSNNEIYKNTIKSCNLGISTMNSNNNVIYLNYFENKKNVYIEKSLEIWNKTIGNRWNNFDEPSEGCVDENYDGICDNPYRIDSNNIDYMPIFGGTSLEKEYATSGGGSAATKQKKVVLKRYTLLSKDLLVEMLKNFGIYNRNFYDAEPSLFAALTPLSEKLDLYPSPFIVDNIKVRKIHGNKFEILQKYITKYYVNVDEIIIARSDIEADAFSAITYAKIKDIPIILTETNELPIEVENIIKNLKPKKIVIVGGPKAVSVEVENELRKHAEVVRIWGETRVETSLEVAKYIENQQDIKVVIIQNGWNISKSSAVVSYLYEAPIIYVGSDISKDVNKYLSKFKNRDVVFIFSNVDESIIEKVKSITGTS